MNSLRLPLLMQSLALVCALLFGGYASASQAQDCGTPRPCDACHGGADCQALLQNACCTPTAASAVEAAFHDHGAQSAADLTFGLGPAQLSGVNFPPPLPPPRPV